MARWLLASILIISLVLLLLPMVLTTRVKQDSSAEAKRSGRCLEAGKLIHPQHRLVIREANEAND